ncbi:MAG: hypothetical protein LRS46_02160 [Desulfurococcales archaeon]|nr:hypothetical protein [Desulfurococcales archaeon]
MTLARFYKYKIKICIIILIVAMLLAEVSHISSSLARPKDAGGVNITTYQHSVKVLSTTRIVRKSLGSYVLIETRTSSLCPVIYFNGTALGNIRVKLLSKEGCIQVISIFKNNNSIPMFFRRECNKEVTLDSMVEPYLFMDPGDEINITFKNIIDNETCIGSLVIKRISSTTTSGVAAASPSRGGEEGYTTGTPKGLLPQTSGAGSLGPRRGSLMRSPLSESVLLVVLALSWVMVAVVRACGGAL